MADDNPDERIALLVLRAGAYDLTGLAPPPAVALPSPLLSGASGEIMEDIRGLDSPLGYVLAKAKAAEVPPVALFTLNEALVVTWANVWARDPDLLGASVVGRHVEEFIPSAAVGFARVAAKIREGANWSGFIAKQSPYSLDGRDDKVNLEARVRWLRKADIVGFAVRVEGGGHEVE